MFILPFVFLVFVFVVLFRVRNTRNRAYAVLAVLAVLSLLAIACDSGDLSSVKDSKAGSFSENVKQGQSTRLSCMTRENSVWVKDDTNPNGGYCASRGD